MTQRYGDTSRQTGEERVVIGGSSETSEYGQHYGDTDLAERRPDHARSHAVGVGQDYDRTTLITRGSRLRGGPVLGGFVIGFATWILLELALFALDLGALAAQVVPSADPSAWWWSGLAAAIGFLVGGLVAGASLPTTRIDDGILNGIAVWAVTLVALVVMSAIGAGIGFGVVGDVLATSPSLADADASVINDAQSASASALLALSVTLAAAAIGGALGSKLWPSHDDVSIDLRR
jgi:hypothetical protein